MILKANYVVVEGLDGSGKTTFVECLSQAIEAEGFIVDPVREPYLPQIRDVVLTPKTSLNSYQREMIFQADRAVLQTRIAAQRDRSVIVSDRSFLSGRVYSGLSPDPELRAFAAALESKSIVRYPDIIFFLDVQPEVCWGRLKDRGVLTFEEQGGLEKMRRVYNKFNELIDGGLPSQVVRVVQEGEPFDAAQKMLSHILGGRK